MMIVRCGVVGAVSMAALLALTLPSWADDNYQDTSGKPIAAVVPMVGCAPNGKCAGAASATNPLPVTDASGGTPVTPAPGTTSTLTTGGTAYTLVTGPVHGCYITNPLSAADQGIPVAETASVNPVTTATNNGYATNSALQPGQSWVCPGALIVGSNVSGIATTSAHRLSVVTW